MRGASRRTLLTGALRGLAAVLEGPLAEASVDEALHGRLEAGPRFVQVGRSEEVEVEAAEAVEERQGADSLEEEHLEGVHPEVVHLEGEEVGLGEVVDLEEEHLEVVLGPQVLVELEDPTNTCKRLPSLWAHVGSGGLGGFF